MNVPENLRYSTDHEWVSVDGDSATIGITDYAQENLNDVVYVQLPAVGDKVTVGSSCGELESTKSVSDVYSPLSGTVTAVNEALAEHPELINNDPYGQGWLYTASVDAPEELDALLDAGAYVGLIDS